MAAPTLYKWDDPGAPQLDGSKGCILNVIVKCLVEGYGTKAGAGWEMVIDLRAEHCAMLAPEGRGWFYRFNDAHSSEQVNSFCLFDTCESFIDFNTVTSVFSYPGFTGRPSSDLFQGVFKGHTSQWWVVADASSAYIITTHGGFPVICFIGKVKAGLSQHSYVALGAYAYWTDHDLFKLGRPDKVGRNFPILEDITKASHETLRANPSLITGSNVSTAKQAIYPDGLMTHLGFSSSTGQLACVFPGGYGALCVPNTERKLGQIENGFLHFAHYSISLTDWWT